MIHPFVLGRQHFDIGWRHTVGLQALRRELRGKRSKRTARLLYQMELHLEELVMAATEDEDPAQAAAVKTASAW